MDQNARIAYFSMEIAVHNDIPTYSGGLGVLAGDMIRSAADLEIPMAAVTLLYRHGYFRQAFDDRGNQQEQPVHWRVDDVLKAMDVKVSVTIEGRQIRLGVYRYDVRGLSGFVIPVYFMDTDLPENGEWDRGLSHDLYGGDKWYRLCQEIILGIGGLRMLRSLGYNSIERFHLNEGHASLLALERISEEMKFSGNSSIDDQVLDTVRKNCVFTTHTPVPAGHDKFPIDLVQQALGHHPAFDRPDIFCCEGELNMTYLALNLSHYTNGVAKKHGEISRKLLTPKHKYVHYEINSITNGVHVATWVCEPIKALFDNYIPNWRDDNFNLRYACGIPAEIIWGAHLEAKTSLIDFVSQSTGAGLDVDTFTIGFARRATAYKRLALIFRDIERLRRLGRDAGALQLIFAGKAHPRDRQGKELIGQIFSAAKALAGDVRVVYLVNYNMELGKMLTSGCDIWLNTPLPPMEASGTSGMKAAVNGVPSLSIMDGWWIEGCIEGITGWAINDHHAEQPDGELDQIHAESLYRKLEQDIIPLFYQDRNRFINIMTHAIALNGSFFNTQRMVQQYLAQAYV